RFVFDHRILTLRRLATARTLGKRGFDFLDRLRLGDALNGRNLSRQAVEGCLVALALAVRLLELRIGAEQVAHYFSNPDDISAVDLGLIFLGAARPHRPLDPGAALQGLKSTLYDRRLRELAHADNRDLRDRNPKRHLVLDEVDDEQLELVSCDF